MIEPEVLREHETSPRLAQVIEALEIGIKRVKGEQPLTGETIMQSLLLDSLDVLELVMILEETFDRDIRGLDLVKQLDPESTISDLAAVFLDTIALV